MSERECGGFDIESFNWRNLHSRGSTSYGSRQLPTRVNSQPALLLAMLAAVMHSAAPPWKLRKLCCESAVRSVPRHSAKREGCISKWGEAPLLSERRREGKGTFSETRQRTF